MYVVHHYIVSVVGNNGLYFTSIVLMMLNNSIVGHNGASGDLCSGGHGRRLQWRNGYFSGDTEKGSLSISEQLKETMIVQ